MGKEINKEEQLLLDRFGRKGPWKVPEGYFAQMMTEVEGKLSDQPQEQRYVEMTRWQKLKPYVYLAAMFLGIWVMMNVFGRVMTNRELNLDNPPEQYAQLMEKAVEQDAVYIPTSLMSAMETEDAVLSEFTDMNEFVEAFNEAGATDQNLE